ncbi:MAG TPA: hypothetical protein VNQ77_16130 [Frankiaceae bacterium]|nr:hypothetical protein [Frankiaceae bacterium]
MTTDDPPGDPDEPRQPTNEAERRAAIEAATERMLRTGQAVLERLRHT